MKGKESTPEEEEKHMEGSVRGEGSKSVVLAK